MEGVGLPEEVRLEPWVISEFLCKKGLEVALVVKNPPANVGDTDVGLIPGSGRSLGQEDPLEEEMTICSSILA